MYLPQRGLEPGHLGEGLFQSSWENGLSGSLNWIYLSFCSLPPPAGTASPYMRPHGGSAGLLYAQTWDWFAFSRFFFSSFIQRRVPMSFFFFNILEKWGRISSPWKFWKKVINRFGSLKMFFFTLCKNTDSEKFFWCVFLAKCWLTFYCLCVSPVMSAITVTRSNQDSLSF